MGNEASDANNDGADEKFEHCTAILKTTHVSFDGGYKSLGSLSLGKKKKVMEEDSVVFFIDVPSYQNDDIIRQFADQMVL